MTEKLLRCILGIKVSFDIIFFKKLRTIFKWVFLIELGAQVDKTIFKVQILAGNQLFLKYGLQKSCFRRSTIDENRVNIDSFFLWGIKQD